MTQKYFRFVPPGRNHVEHAGRKSRFLPELGDAHGGLRHEARGFENQTVARGDADRRHPALGNHGRKVPRGNAGKDTDRMVVSRRVVSGRNVHQGVALHDVRRAAGEFHDLGDFEHVAHRFIPFLAHFPGEQIGQFFEMLVQQSLQIEEHLDPLAYGSVGPCRIGIGPQPGSSAPPLPPNTAEHRQSPRRSTDCSRAYTWRSRIGSIGRLREYFSLTGLSPLIGSISCRLSSKKYRLFDESDML